MSQASTHTEIYRPFEGEQGFVVPLLILLAEETDHAPGGHMRRIDRGAAAKGGNGPCVQPQKGPQLTGGMIDRRPQRCTHASG